MPVRASATKPPFRAHCALLILRAIAPATGAKFAIMRAAFDEDKKLMAEKSDLNALSGRFRGFYPVVIDVETAGFNANTDALLEIAAVTLKMDEDGWLQQDETLHFHVEPFEGANLQPEALAFNGIDPHNPLRGAVSEYDALHAIFKAVRKGLRIAVATGPLSWHTTPTSITVS